MGSCCIRVPTEAWCSEVATVTSAIFPSIGETAGRCRSLALLRFFNSAIQFGVRPGAGRDRSDPSLPAQCFVLTLRQVACVRRSHAFLQSYSTCIGQVVDSEFLQSRKYIGALRILAMPARRVAARWASHGAPG